MTALIRDPKTNEIQQVSGPPEAVEALCAYARANGGEVEIVEATEVSRA